MRRYQMLAYVTLGIDGVVVLLGLFVLRVPRGAASFWFGLTVFFLSILGAVFPSRDSWEKRREKRKT